MIGCSAGHLRQLSLFTSVEVTVRAGWRTCGVARECRWGCVCAWRPRRWYRGSRARQRVHPRESRVCGLRPNLEGVSGQTMALDIWMNAWHDCARCSSLYITFHNRFVDYSTEQRRCFSTMQQDNWFPWVIGASALGINHDAPANATARRKSPTLTQTSGWAVSSRTISRVRARVRWFCAGLAFRTIKVFFPTLRELLEYSYSFLRASLLFQNIIRSFKNILNAFERALKIF